MIVRGFTTDGTAEKLTPFPCGPGGSGVDTDDQQATEVPYDNSGSGLTANDVQEAIDELAAQVAACCEPGGGGISSGDLLSTGEVGGSSGQDQLFPAFEIPDNADYSWDNQGGASVTVNDNGSISLDAPSTTSVNVRMRYKAISGSAPYTVTAMFSFNHRQDAQRYGGLAFRQNDGKFVALVIDGTRVLHVYKFNSTTSFDSDAANTTIPAYHFLWLRIVDDNTNRIYQWSLDGYTWQTLFSETRTTFITATQFAFIAVDHANTANQKAVTTLYSIKQT